MQYKKDELILLAERLSSSIKQNHAGQVFKVISTGGFFYDSGEQVWDETGYLVGNDKVCFHVRSAEIQRKATTADKRRGSPVFYIGQYLRNKYYVIDLFWEKNRWTYVIYDTSLEQQTTEIIKESALVKRAF